jgi:hypothetical protein
MALDRVVLVGIVARVLLVIAARPSLLAPFFRSSALLSGVALAFPCMALNAVVLVGIVARVLLFIATLPRRIVALSICHTRDSKKSDTGNN